MKKIAGLTYHHFPMSVNRTFTLKDMNGVEKTVTKKFSFIDGFVAHTVSGVSRMAGSGTPYIALSGYFHGVNRARITIREEENCKALQDVLKGNVLEQRDASNNETLKEPMTFKCAVDPQAAQGFGYFVEDLSLVDPKDGSLKVIIASAGVAPTASSQGINDVEF